MELADWQIKEQPLLESGVVILPDEIDYNAFFEMSWAIPAATRQLKGRASNPAIICNSSGGSISHILAICDLVRRYNIDGIVIGSAISGASIIWASCYKRFFGPLSRLMIHECMEYTSDKRVGGTGIYVTQADYHSRRNISMLALNAKIAEIYADASKAPAEWWLGKMSEGNSSFYELWADDLYELGMGEFLLDEKSENERLFYNSITSDRNGNLASNLQRSDK